MQIRAAVDKSKGCISQTPGLLIHCDIELALSGNCHWWRKKNPKISFDSICGKLKSMRLNGVIKIWSDHWRPTMTTNAEQSSFLEQTKPLSGLNVVQCGYWSFWNSLWNPNFFFIALHYFPKRAGDTIKDLPVIEKHRDFYFLKFLQCCVYV